MSEIKGQLLGIVLVVAVFGAVGGMLLYAFQSSGKSIAEKVTTIDEVTPEDPSKVTVGTIKDSSSVDNSIISNDELLTF